MKKALFILIFLSSYFVSGQTMIKSQLSPEHKEIRGSKINIIPPKGFTIASNFLGFQDAKTNSSIIVLEVPASFDKTSGSLTVENLLKQGVKALNIETIIFNGLKAKFIKSEQTAYGIDFIKYSLVFGTESETMMINGIFPKENIQLEQEITKAIMSSVYNPEKVISALDTVDFQISVEGTDFVFAKSMSNMLIYSRDGKMPTELNDKASIVIAKSISKLEISDKKEFSINKIKGLTMQISKILQVEPISINGLSGYEILADGVNRKTGAKEQAYQVLLFNHLDYYVLYGSSSDNYDANSKIFKRIAASFKLK